MASEGGGGADMVGVSMTNRVDTEYVEQRQLICRRLGLFPQMRSCICEAECRPDDGQMVSRGKSLFNRGVQARFRTLGRWFICGWLTLEARERRGQASSRSWW